MLNNWQGHEEEGKFFQLYINTDLTEISNPVINEGALIISDLLFRDLVCKLCRRSFCIDKTFVDVHLSGLLWFQWGMLIYDPNSCWPRECQVSP
jgi:hypothetical protein